jgi:hypothetical protein
MRAAVYRVARPRAQVELAERYIQLQPTLAGAIGSDGAVDLARVACAQSVHTIQLRPLLAEGCLIPDSRGFTVQVNNGERLTIDPAMTTLRDRELTTKQRYTVAHEIAHTFMYDLGRTPPSERPGALKTVADLSGGEPNKSLEAFCQTSAGIILTPILGLKKELARFKKTMDLSGTVDSLDVVLQLARMFRVSPEVMIHRIGHIEETDLVRAADYALFMITADGLEQVRAYLYSSTLPKFLAPPKRYSRFRRWIERTNLPIPLADSPEGEWPVLLRGGELQIKKRRLRYSYFVEVRFRYR